MFKEAARQWRGMVNKPNGSGGGRHSAPEINRLSGNLVYAARQQRIRSTRIEQRRTIISTKGGVVTTLRRRPPDRHPH
jgi:hypothetical protein